VRRWAPRRACSAADAAPPPPLTNLGPSHANQTAGRYLGYASGADTGCAPNAPYLQGAASARGAVWRLRSAPAAGRVTLEAARRRRGCAAALTAGGGGKQCAGALALNRTGYERWAAIPAPDRPGAYFLETSDKGCAPQRLEPARGCTAAALAAPRAGAPAWRFVRVSSSVEAPPRSPLPAPPASPAPPAPEVTLNFTVLGVAPEDFDAAQQAAFCAELLERLGLTGGDASCAVTSVAPSGGATRRRLAQSGGGGGSDVTFTLTFEVGANADAAAVAAVEALVQGVLNTLEDWTLATALISASVAAAFPGLAVSVVVAGGPPPPAEPSFPPVTTSTPAPTFTPAPTPVPANPCAGVVCFTTNQCKTAGACAGGACPAPTNKAAGTSCATYLGSSPGNCDGAGVCSALCTGVTCTGANQCLTCGLTTGACDTPKAGTPACDFTAAGNGKCNVGGACVAACDLTTCPSTQCTDPGTCSGAGVCSAPTNKAAGTACTITAAADGLCDSAGACAPAPPAGSWAAVSEGSTFGCGVDVLQRAWCWGTNFYGALGQGGTPSSRRRLLAVAPSQLNLPATILSALSFSSITAGADHACALSTAGAAYCWGAPPPPPTPFRRRAAS
jgi:hypothetical protein